MKKQDSSLPGSTKTIKPKTILAILDSLSTLPIDSLSKENINYRLFKAMIRKGFPASEFVPLLNEMVRVTEKNLDSYENYLKEILVLKRIQTSIELCYQRWTSKNQILNFEGFRAFVNLADNYIKKADSLFQAYRSVETIILNEGGWREEPKERIGMIVHSIQRSVLDYLLNQYTQLSDTNREEKKIAFDNFIEMSRIMMSSHRDPVKVFDGIKHLVDLNNHHCDELITALLTTLSALKKEERSIYLNIDQQNPIQPQSDPGSMVGENLSPREADQQYDDIDKTVADIWNSLNNPDTRSSSLFHQRISSLINHVVGSIMQQNNPQEALDRVIKQFEAYSPHSSNEKFANIISVIIQKVDAAEKLVSRSDDGHNISE